MSDNESEPQTDTPDDHLVLEPMPVFDAPAEDSGTPGSPSDDATTAASVEPGADSPVGDSPRAADRVDASEDVTPEETTAVAEPVTTQETTGPDGAPEPTPPGDTPVGAGDSPVTSDTDASTPEPVAAPGPTTRDEVTSGTPPRAEDPSTKMWASVRDRIPIHPSTETTPEATGPTPPEEPAPAMTGEEVALTPTEDTAEIVGTMDSSLVETGTIEPVPTTTHRIPVIPASGSAPAGEPVSSAPPQDGRDDLPSPPPRDVLENRRTSAAASTTDEVTPEVPGSTAETDILGDPAPTPAPQWEAAVPLTAGPLDATAVQRRSLVVPTSTTDEAGASETSWRPRPEETVGSGSAATPGSLDDALFEGSTVIPVVPSRTAAHLWGVLLSVILVPVTWFALADAGARMTLATNAPMTTGTLNFAALLELLGGLLAVAVLAFLALRSSLGAHITGILVTLIGIPWVVAPGWTARTVLPAMDRLSSWNTLGQNIAHHLQASGYSGGLLLMGVVLLLVGAVSHRVRRRGRADEALRAEVERVNPAGAHFTARERRAATRSTRDSGR